MIPDEPVRGSVPPSWFWAMSGADRMRAISGGLLPQTPVSRLLGIRNTHVGAGSGTWTMPATEASNGPTGQLEMPALAEVALRGAATTAVQPGTEVVTLTIGLNYFRPARPQQGNILARARVTNISNLFVFTEVEIEDPQGRQIAHATSQARLAQIDPPPPAPSVSLEAVEEPAYSTPDPYLRASDVNFPAWRPGEELGYMKALAVGEEDAHYWPAANLYGMRMVSAETGHVTATIPASEWFSDTSRELTAGCIGAFADMASFGVAHSYCVENDGSSLAGLDQHLRFLSRIPSDGRLLAADARGVRHGDMFVAHTDVRDADGTVVAESTGCVAVVDASLRRSRKKAETKRILATLLFTDIVDSTGHAERLGDADWRTLLDDHHAAVRREISQADGIEIKNTGDGFVVRFESPGKALACARSIRSTVRRLGIEIRAGLHTGECELQGRDLAGMAVHIAARIEEAASPGEILVTSTVKDLAVGSGTRFEDRGSHEIKGVSDQWHLYAVGD